MPADKRRKLVVARMYPRTIKSLDKLRVLRTVKLNRTIGRSEMLNLLVEEAAKREVTA